MNSEFLSLCLVGDVCILILLADNWPNIKEHGTVSEVSQHIYHGI